MSRRSTLLRVIDRLDERPVRWEPRPGLPAGGRAECRNGERPCPYVRCKWHLWLVLGEDRPGRRARREGEDERAAPGTTLLPAWLEHPTPACCGLDIAEAMGAHTLQMDLEELASTLHLSYASLWSITRRALEKLRALQQAQELDRDP